MLEQQKRAGSASHGKTVACASGSFCSSSPKSLGRFVCFFRGWSGGFGRFLLVLPGVRFGDFSSRQERAEIASHAAGLFQGQSTAKWRHASAAAFQNGAGDLVIGARRLPAGVGEIRHIGDVPDTPAVRAMAADAIPIVQAHDNPLFIVGAVQPVPRSPHLVPRPNGTGAWTTTSMIAAARTGTPEAESRGNGISCGNGDQNKGHARQNQETAGQ